MRKFRIFLRFDREEKWLEQMAAQGWLLSGKSFFYRFKKTAPKERTIRIDFREGKSAKDFRDYCALFEDSGWKHIAGTKWSGSQYFLKRNESSTEDIFSDVLSRAGRYKRLSYMWLCSAAALVPLLLSMNSELWIHYSLFAPKEWYLTPGLWELQGVSFWWAFLFETPFALMRGIGGVLPAVFILIYVGCGLKSWQLYRTVLEDGMRG